MSASSSDRVPIFIELRRIRPEFGVDDLILEALQKYKLPHSHGAWGFFAESGKFVLLMDAFDEVDPLLSERTVAEIENIADLYSETLQIIVTSRPDADIQKSARFRVCKLSPLSENDHLPFLKKICIEKEQAESLMKVLQANSTDIRELLTTPLMMTLLVILYKSLQTIPDTVPRFYEELFDVLFYRHDHSKPGFRRKRYTNLDDSKVKNLFSAFCFYVRLQGLGALTNAQLENCCERASKACNEPVESEKFKNELIKTICLMQQDGFEISFIHKSVAQYYAAAFVGRSGDEFAGHFYDLARKKGGWELELKFLSQIDTYRYAKKHEMPVLNSIAATLPYSYISRDDSAGERLSKYMLENIKLIIPNEKAIKKDRKKEVPDDRFFLGWAFSKVDDPVLVELSRYWMDKVVPVIWREIPKNSALIPSDEDIDEMDSHERTISFSLFADLIKEKLPSLGNEIVKELQARYDKSALIISTEEEKASMLASFI